MRFKSLQTKYLVLISCSLAALALIISIVCVVNYSRVLEQVAASRMNLVTNSFAQEISGRLQNMGLTTTTLADYVRERVESIDRLETDGDYRKAYLNDIDDFALRVMQTDNIMTSYYVRFDMNAVQDNVGFRYRRNDTGGFRPAELTNIANYDKDDFEHVGWYYEPIKAGVATLMEPYYDANQNLYKVTYAIPTYREGRLLAVVGADVAFQSLADSLSSLHVMPDATVFLCRSTGELYYHSAVEMDDATVRAKYFSPGAELDESSGDQLLDGTMGDVPIKYTYERIFGDLYVVDARPVSGIFQSVNDLIFLIASAATALVLVTVLLALAVSRSIVKPLRELDDAASKILDSDAIFALEPRGEDEVATLTRHFQDVARELKTSLDHLNSIAYRDSLTGVRNKRGYDIEVDMLNDLIARGSAEFGIGVFDVNGLKEVNDTYGHEAGNEVIVTASTRIKECFKHSAVFRIGGDEFVCVLMGNDIEKLDERLEHFRKLAIAENAIADEPWQEVLVARGTALFDPANDTCVADVFARADEEMYRNKASMKGEGNVR